MTNETTLGIETTDLRKEYGHTVAVGSDFASENPETVRTFLRATARGTVWAAQNPDAAVDALVSARPELEEVRENQRDDYERVKRLANDGHKGAPDLARRARWDA